MVTRRFLAAAVLALGLASALAGCEGGDGRSDDGTLADPGPQDPGVPDVPADGVSDPGRDPAAVDPGPADEGAPDEGPADTAPPDAGTDEGPGDTGRVDPGPSDPGVPDPGPGTKQAGESCADFPDCANGMSCISGQFTRAHCNPMCTTEKDCTDAAPGSKAQCSALGGYQICIWWCGMMGGGATCPGDLTCDGATCG